MFQSILRLKQLGYQPDHILDIGANTGQWTIECMRIYPNIKYDLFEAIDYSELHRFYGHPNIKVHNIILNEKEIEVDWYEMRNTGDSIFREKTHHFEHCKPMKKLSKPLSSFFDISVSKHFFIKIDCQGAEIPILKGTSKELLEKTDFIILEIPLFGQYNEGVPNFLEHIQFMDSIGFIPYDIADNHYVCGGFNIQVDFLFIRRDHEFHELLSNRLMNK